MKRTIAILIAAVLALAFLAGCNSGMKEDSNSQGSGNSYAAPSTSASYAPEDGDYYLREFYAADEVALVDGEYTFASSEGKPAEVGANAGTENFAEKIIYSAYAEIETIEFDATIDSLTDMLGYYGAFIEDSYVGGRNYAQSYYGTQTYRQARYTLRVPANRLGAFRDSLESLGNVTSSSSNAENITSQFYDTQSRLTSLRTQEERLLDMLAKSETVADMLTIEERLADVRYHIESITTTLRNWQSLVDYSTLTLQIKEVEKLTEFTPIQQSYWEQISDGLKSTTKSVGEFFSNVFKWLAINLPIIIVLAVIAVIIVIIVKLSTRKARKNKEKRIRDGVPANAQRLAYPAQPQYMNQPPYMPGEPYAQQQYADSAASQPYVEEQPGADSGDADGDEGASQDPRR